MYHSDHIQTIQVRNNVNISGSGSRTIMFAHGLGSDQTMWRFVAPAFSEDNRVVLFDYVGCGRSDLGAYHQRRYRDLKGYAEDVLDICEAFDLRDVVFVGHSVSSMIGMLAAIQAPERFERFVMIGPSPRYLNQAPDYFGGFECSDLEGLLDLMDRNYSGWANYLAPVVVKNSDRPELARELEQTMCATDPAIMRHFAEATFFADHRSDVTRMPVPSLILQCADDAISPPQACEYLHRHMPGSELQVMRAAGHCPHLCEPVETINCIGEYLAVGRQLV